MKSNGYGAPREKCGLLVAPHTVPVQHYAFHILLRSVLEQVAKPGQIRAHLMLR